MGTPVIIGAREIAALNALRDRATEAPIDMHEVLRDIETPEGRERHFQRMNALTIPIPMAYNVTFSVESGHPGGRMRHMSMSAPEGRVPIPLTLWMIAEHLGFRGSLETCNVYPEALAGGHTAINVVQPVIG